LIEPVLPPLQRTFEILYVPATKFGSAGTITVLIPIHVVPMILNLMVYVPGTRLKMFDVCHVTPLSPEYSNVPGAPDAKIATVPIPAVAHDAADAA
jgi:hypothetical protein